MEHHRRAPLFAPPVAGSAALHGRGTPARRGPAPTAALDGDLFAGSSLLLWLSQPPHARASSVGSTPCRDDPACSMSNGLPRARPGSAVFGARSNDEPAKRSPSSAAVGAGPLRAGVPRPCSAAGPATGGAKRGALRAPASRRPLQRDRPGSAASLLYRDAVLPPPSNPKPLQGLSGSGQTLSKRPSLGACPGFDQQQPDSTLPTRQRFRPGSAATAADQLRLNAAEAAYTRTEPEPGCQLGTDGSKLPEHPHGACIGGARHGTPDPGLVQCNDPSQNPRRDAAHGDETAHGDGPGAARRSAQDTAATARQSRNHDDTAPGDPTQGTPHDIPHARPSDADVGAARRSAQDTAATARQSRNHDDTAGDPTQGTPHGIPHARPSDADVTHGASRDVIGNSTSHATTREAACTATHGVTYDATKDGIPTGMPHATSCGFDDSRHDAPPSPECKPGSGATCSQAAGAASSNPPGSRGLPGEAATAPLHTLRKVSFDTAGAVPGSRSRADPALPHPEGLLDRRLASSHLGSEPDDGSSQLQHAGGARQFAAAAGSLPPSAAGAETGCGVSPVAEGRLDFFPGGRGTSRHSDDRLSSSPGNGVKSQCVAASVTEGRLGFVPCKGTSRHSDDRSSSPSRNGARSERVAASEMEGRLGFVPCKGTSRHSDDRSSSPSRNGAKSERVAASETEGRLGFAPRQGTSPHTSSASSSTARMADHDRRGTGNRPPSPLPRLELPHRANEGRMGGEHENGDAVPSLNQSPQQQAPVRGGAQDRDCDDYDADLPCESPGHSPRQRLHLNHKGFETEAGAAPSPSQSPQRQTPVRGGAKDRDGDGHDGVDPPCESSQLSPRQRLHLNRKGFETEASVAPSLNQSPQRQTPVRGGAKDRDGDGHDGVDPPCEGPQLSPRQRLKLRACAAKGTEGQGSGGEGGGGRSATGRRLYRAPSVPATNSRRQDPPQLAAGRGQNVHPRAGGGGVLACADPPQPAPGLPACDNGPAALPRRAGGGGVPACADPPQPAPGLPAGSAALPRRAGGGGGVPAGADPPQPAPGLPACGNGSAALPRRAGGASSQDWARQPAASLPSNPSSREDTQSDSSTSPTSNKAPPASTRDNPPIRASSQSTLNATLSDWSTPVANKAPPEFARDVPIRASSQFALVAAKSDWSNPRGTAIAKAPHESACVNSIRASSQWTLEATPSDSQGTATANKVPHESACVNSIRASSQGTLEAPPSDSLRMASQCTLEATPSDSRGTAAANKAPRESACGNPIRTLSQFTLEAARFDWSSSPRAGGTAANAAKVLPPGVLEGIPEPAAHRLDSFGTAMWTPRRTCVSPQGYRARLRSSEVQSRGSTGVLETVSDRGRNRRRSDSFGSAPWLACPSPWTPLLIPGASGPITRLALDLFTPAADRAEHGMRGQAGSNRPQSSAGVAQRMQSQPGGNSAPRSSVDVAQCSNSVRQSPADAAQGMRGQAGSNRPQSSAGVAQRVQSQPGGNSAPRSSVDVAQCTQSPQPAEVVHGSAQDPAAAGSESASASATPSGKAPQSARPKDATQCTLDALAEITRSVRNRGLADEKLRAGPASPPSSDATIWAARLPEASGNARPGEGGTRGQSASGAAGCLRGSLADLSGGAQSSSQSVDAWKTRGQSALSVGGAAQHDPTTPACRSLGPKRKRRGVATQRGAKHPAADRTPHPSPGDRAMDMASALCGAAAAAAASVLGPPEAASPHRLLVVSKNIGGLRRPPLRSGSSTASAHRRHPALRRRPSRLARTGKKIAGRIRHH
ncbi:hypothetical protein DIPPA_22962 [Diplonema papillatum]|nr:hypothetical protein DIPPA_22962 [Diplonema papillatum]